MSRESKYDFGQKHIVQKKFRVQSYYDWSKLQYIPAHELAYYETINVNNIEPEHKNQPAIIICLHGLSRNARDFDRLMYIFDDSIYKVYSIDIVGRGDSDWFINKLHYNFNTYTNDISQFIKSINNSKSVTIIGTSMGGLIAMMIAYKYPSLIKNIVLNDVGPHIPAIGLKNIADYVSEVREFQNLDEAKTYFKRVFSTFGITDEEDWLYITKHSVYKNHNNMFELKYDPNIIWGFKNSFTNFFDINLWYMWYRIHCPIMIIRGEKSTILLQETANKMILSKNNVKFYTFKNIGHAPSLMNDSELNIIYNWLNSVN